MNAIVQMARTVLSGVIRDLGTLWVRSLVTRAVLSGLALLAAIGAAAFLIASAHQALTIALGALYANLIMAGTLLAIGAGFFFASRAVRRRAELRRRHALQTLGLFAGAARAAASTAASRNALVVVAAALAAGFLFGNASGDGGDEDE